MIFEHGNDDGNNENANENNMNENDNDINMNENDNDIQMNENDNENNNENLNGNLNENYVNENDYANDYVDNESIGENSDDDEDMEDLYHEIELENEQAAANEDPTDYLRRTLREWSLRGVSLRKLDSLLKILALLYPDLPKTHTGLLGTPHAHNADEIVQMGTGLFWYKGIEKNLRQRVTQTHLLKHETIAFDVNMDGFQPFNTSFDEQWPTLGRLKDEEEPFIIGIWKGKGKPGDINQFLGNYVREARLL